MLAQMPQLKATGSVPAAIQQICLSSRLGKASWPTEKSFKRKMRNRQREQKRENRQNKTHHETLKGQIGVHKAVNRGDMTVGGLT